MFSFKNLNKIIVLFIIAGFMFNSCASIFKGASEDVEFNSEPSNAKIFINGAQLGSTPAKISLESKKTYIVEIKKEGYETKTYQISNSFRIGFLFMDICFTGVIGIVIDAATGSWYSLDENYYQINLEKNDKTN